MHQSLRITFEHKLSTYFTFSRPCNFLKLNDINYLQLLLAPRGVSHGALKIFSVRNRVRHDASLAIILNKEHSLSQKYFSTWRRTSAHGTQITLCAARAENREFSSP